MDEKSYGAEASVGTSASHDVQTELIALQADVRGLAESVQRLVAEAPAMAKDRLEDSIRGEPLRASFIAAGIGFVLAVVLLR